MAEYPINDKCYSSVQNNVLKYTSSAQSTTLQILVPQQVSGVTSRVWTPIIKGAQSGIQLVHSFTSSPSSGAVPDAALVYSYVSGTSGYINSATASSGTLSMYHDSTLVASVSIVRIVSAGYSGAAADAAWISGYTHSVQTAATTLINNTSSSLRSGITAVSSAIAPTVSSAISSATMWWSSSVNNLSSRVSGVQSAVSSVQSAVSSAILPSAFTGVSASSGQYTRIVDLTFSNAAGSGIAFTSFTVGANELRELNDVIITSASSGQILGYDGSAWRNQNNSGGGSGGGTTITSMWQSSGAIFVSQSNSAVHSAVYSSTVSSMIANIQLGDLSGVSITSPSSGQALSYNGSEWINSSIPTSDTHISSMWQSSGAIYISQTDGSTYSAAYSGYVSSALSAKMDKVSQASSGHIVFFDSSGNAIDKGIQLGNSTILGSSVSSVAIQSAVYSNILATSSALASSIDTAVVYSGSAVHEITEGANVALTLTGSTLQIAASAGGGTSDYDSLTNKPQIGGVTLSGNKTLDDLSIPTSAAVSTIASSAVSSLAPGIASSAASSIAPAIASSAVSSLVPSIASSAASDVVSAHDINIAAHASGFFHKLDVFSGVVVCSQAQSGTMWDAHVMQLQRPNGSARRKYPLYIAYHYKQVGGGMSGVYNMLQYGGFQIFNSTSSSITAGVYVTSSGGMIRGGLQLRGGSLVVSSGDVTLSSGSLISAALSSCTAPTEPIESHNSAIANTDYVYSAITSATSSLVQSVNGQTGAVTVIQGYNQIIVSSAVTLSDKDFALIQSDCVVTLPVCSSGYSIGLTTIGTTSSATIQPATGDSIYINGSAYTDILLDKPTANLYLYGTSSGWQISELGYLAPNAQSPSATQALITNKISEHNTSSSAHSTLFAAKADLASPAFTGTPTAPTAPDGTSTTQIATTAFVKNNFIGLAVGTIFPYVSIVPPAGAYLLNGQTIASCQTLYPDFWTWITAQVTAGRVRAVTTAVFQAEVSTTGNCGAFVIDTSAGSVRLPSVTTGFIQGTDGTTTGNSVAAGLPNITGSLYSIGNYTTTSGAFSADSTQTLDVAGATAQLGVFNKTFSASSCSSIYGNSTTVQPPSVRYFWCIQVYNATTTLSSQQATQFAAQLQGKADTALNNLTAVGTAKTNIPGTVIMYAGSTVPTGYLPCYGAAYSRTTYAALYAIIGTTYGAGDGSTTFNVPDLTDKFVQGNSTVGTIKSAGLPNITQTGIDPTTATWGIPFNPLTGGAFYNEGSLVTVPSVAYTASSDQLQRTVAFNASRCSSIYGNSTTVQPPALTLNFAIKY